MPIVRRSIIVDAPLAFTFEVSNRVEDWPQIMDDYSGVEILGREGAKMFFRLHRSDGSSWVSWRVIHPDGAFALAERHEPRAPFRFMQHAWTYHALDGGRTEMTWEMHFGLPAADAERERAACAHIAASTERNQARMKAYIEGNWAASGDPRGGAVVA
jgi:aromatase